MTQKNFDPKKSLYEEANATGVINMFMEKVMDDHQGEYPDHDQLDALVPSLKGLVMEKIETAKLQICKCIECDLDSMAADIKELLPPEELTAIREAMGIPQVNE